MSLRAQVREFVHAAFSGLWVHTWEPDEAEREILQLAKDERWRAATWDVANGLRVIGADAPRQEGGGDPLSVLRTLPNLAHPQGTAVLLLHNFHRFLSSPEVIQTTFAQLIAGKQQRTFLIVLAPVVQVPVELEKHFI